MILDTIQNARRYLGISKPLDAALLFLSEKSLNALPEGRTDIAPGVYVNIFQVQRKPAADCGWERHEQYIDIQLSLSGEEAVGVAPIQEISQWTAYQPDKDIALSPAPGMGDAIRLIPERFLILFPQDAHKPGAGSGAGKKAVLKVCFNPS